ncbi:MAG: ribonuclease P protein component [Bacteroidetes bacterium]|nr:ribonuclease P protein component [Bacteroidota bacterium]
MPLTFSKNERLHELRFIRSLFERGRVFSNQPLKITWMKIHEKTGPFCQVMISVPKAVQRKSVNRNIIRRRLREAYRLNKSILYTDPPPGLPNLVFCLTYTSKEILTYRSIHDKIILLLRRLKEECEKDC